MSPSTLTIEPLLSAADREELSHLDYLLARMMELRDRGLIVADSYATVVAESRGKRDAIERQGRYQAAMKQAMMHVKSDPETALAWAERACELDPSRIKPWELLVSLNWALEHDDTAIALCGKAAKRFPTFQAELERLESERPGRAETRQRIAEQARQESDARTWLAQARLALDERRDGDAIALCRQVLEQQPEHTGALAIAAYAHQRLEEFDEALPLYELLIRLQPFNTSWPQWVRHIQLRRNVQRLTGNTVWEVDTGEDSADGSRSRGFALPPPPLSWSSFAGAFLEEHWQKLILCLAVLLIVVGSTVGLGVLLGPLLWSPLGKCTLALIPTSLLAVFGAGLMRWGADRAGRMLLIATLIVVPIHFMLAGELKLLLEPSAFSLIVLAGDALVLLVLVRGVSGMLAPRPGARFLTATLLLLSIGSAATASGTAVAWNWQFAAFQAPALIFLSAVWAVGIRRWGSSDEEHRDFAYMIIGLLGFALVACVVRTGAYALRLDPQLYAVPLMVVAIAIIHAARRLVPYGPDAQHLAWLRFGAYVLSGLAFAVALGRPPVPAPRFSANLIAVGVLGLGLYASSLRNLRHPAFLYLSAGALVVAGLGIRFFVAHRCHLIEEIVRTALHYPDHLPWPFRAIPFLLASTALASLSIWISRHWNDRGLARHCHYLGVPLSIAACVASGFEPVAALICLSGYAILYLVAVWVFGAPWVTYLGIASLTGAVYFGSTLVPGITLADKALFAAGLGLGFWAIRVLLRRVDIAEACRLPWLHAALLLMPVALSAATLHLAWEGANSFAAASAFVLVGILAVLLNRERPRTIWAYLALVSLLEFTICGLVLSAGGTTLHAPAFGLLFMFDGLAALAVAEGLRFLVRQAEEQTGASESSGTVDTRWAGSFLSAIPRFVVALTLIADWSGLVEIDVARSAAGLVFLLGSACFLWTTRHFRRTTLVYLGLAQFVVGALVLASWSITGNSDGIQAGWLAVTAAAIAIALWSVGVGTRRAGISEFYAAPCFNTTLALTVGVFALAIEACNIAGDAYQLSALALVSNTLITMLLAYTWRRAELTYAAVLHFVAATYLILFNVGQNDPRMAYVLGLVAVIEAIVFWTIGFVCRRARHDWTNACAWPLDHWAIVLTGVAVLLSDRSSLVLALVGLSFLLMVKGRPHVEWLYGTVAALGAACYFAWLSSLSRVGLIGSATLAAFVLWALGVLLQRFKPVLCHRLGLRPLDYEFPLFHSSIVVGLIAILLRVGLSLESGTPWAAQSWFPPCLAVLAFVMLRAYPRRECLHLSLAFLTWSVVAAIAPTVSSLGFLSLAGMTLALAFLIIERVVRPFEPRICQRLGVLDVGYAPVVHGWASALFGLASVLAIGVVFLEMGAAVIVERPSGLGFLSVDWWALMATLGLLGAFLVAEGTDPHGWLASEPEQIVIALHALSVIVLWWLGVSCSPLASGAVTAGLYYPLATAMAALATAQLVRRYTRGESWNEFVWLGDLRSERLARMLSYQTCIFSVLAVVFTKGALEPTTVLTLVLAAVSLGLTAIECGWDMAGVAGSLSWAAAWGVGFVVVAMRLGITAVEQRTTCAAVGILLAAFSLWALAGRFRRDESNVKGRSTGDLGPAQTRWSGLPWALERVALACSLFSAVVVLMAGTDPGALGGFWTFGGVGVLLGSALLQILLVPRWQAEWLVYLAQAVMVGAYVDFRMAYPLPVTTDAIMLTLLGYLDLGIAEVLERLQSKIYARPARYFSLVLPALPLIQLFWSGGLDEVHLFHLFAAATFYGVACAQFQWKSLGYASAVIYNAALWVLWSRLGWRFADNPQFYLVPVGLSTILFAEVNRHDLGRSTVNTIRSVGLILIYLSLAMPIWQFESLGAWLTLLLCSLAGVFLGIGLRLQTFLWLGLATFVLDVVYQMGRVSLDHALAKWAIMLALGLMLVVFVALNEKKRIVATMRVYYGQARLWE
jgi:tetratricopeptide (TPR) repeat protein